MAEVPKEDFHVTPLNEGTMRDALSSPPAPSNDMSKEQPIHAGKQESKLGGIGRRFLSGIVNGSFKEAKDDVIKNVLQPQIQKTVIDAVTNGVNSFFRGSGKKAVKEKEYDQMFGQQRDMNHAGVSRKGSESGYRDIEFDDYETAKAVLEDLKADASRYNAVTLASYYERSGIRPVDAQYNHYGWYRSDLEDARMIPTENGVTLELKSPRYLR